MAIVSGELRGIVHGRTIELEEAPGLPDGQSVTVTVQPIAEKLLGEGEGIRRSAGAWKDDLTGLDEDLRRLREARDQDRAMLEP